MSAAAARRRKQLLTRKQQAADGGNGDDPVAAQLIKLLEDESLSEESTAYEALQLAQSQVRKKVHAGDFKAAVDLAYGASLAIVKKGRVSVASQIMTVLVEVMRETHTEETEELVNQIVELHQEHQKSMESGTGVEANRLHRLQRDWLRRCVQWSSDLGTIRFGHTRLQELLAQQCWHLAQVSKDDEEEDELMELRSDAVTHMALAEQPLQIVEWLKTMPAPTAQQTATGHTCPPAERDALLTRAVLCLCAIENLRDANILLRKYLETVEERKAEDLQKSYTSKEDGKAPSHVIFGCMLVRICEKDARTGPLFSWLIRSFKRELDGLFKVQIIQSYTTKIGKIYFNIQPPPSMLNMVENMMGMMGGGGGGMNPAMMQAALAQMGGAM
jgi:Golgi to ER traffic protein 4